MHFIYIKINVILLKTDEVSYIATKVTNTLYIAIGISETKLGKTILPGELEVNGYDSLRLDRSRRVQLHAHIEQQQRQLLNNSKMHSMCLIARQSCTVFKILYARQFFAIYCYMLFRFVYTAGMIPFPVNYYQYLRMPL